MASENPDVCRIKVAPLAYVKLLMATLQHVLKSGDIVPTQKIAGLFTGRVSGKDVKILDFFYLKDLGELDLHVNESPDFTNKLKTLRKDLLKEDPEDRQEIVGWVSTVNSTELIPGPNHLKTQYFLQSEVSENIIGAMFAPALLEESHGLSFFSFKGDFRFITEFSPLIIHEYMLAICGEQAGIFDFLIELNNQYHMPGQKLLVPLWGSN